MRDRAVLILALATFGAPAGAVVVAGASAALLVPDYGEGTVDVTARRASW